MTSQLRNLPFRHPQVGKFFQAGPKLENPYTGDGFLQRLLRRLFTDDEAYHEMHKDLIRFGERVRTEIDLLGDECEKNPPYLNQYNPWGNRIDDIVTCEAWKKMKCISAEEQLIALGYKSRPQIGRLHQFAKLFMFGPSSGLFNCPLAMTDGAAKSIKVLKHSSLNYAFDCLTSSDPSTFWTSGQWMTERRGGSDVGSGTETVAVPGESRGKKYKLYGYKWFSSATDADMAFTLARIANPDGSTQPGTRGLSMFFVKLRKADGSLNNIQVMKLKNKLGTRQLPTGELLLDGTEAELVSDEGRGVASISHMLTITRIHNGTASTANMRRITSLARDYSKRRICFGSPICQYPLHVDTIAALELETRACTALLFEVVRLLGCTEVENQQDDEDQLLLRLLNPIMKLYTGKKCVPIVSEGLECIGGQGYIEDTGIPKLLRDTQVTPIWEGTTNILSLDVLRAIEKSKGKVIVAWESNMRKRLKNSLSACAELKKEGEKVSNGLEKLKEILQGPMVHERSARLLAFSLAELTIGMLLIEQAAGNTASKTDMITASRWNLQMPDIKERFVKMQYCDKDTNGDSNELVFDSYQE